MSALTRACVLICIRQCECACVLARVPVCVRMLQYAHRMLDVSARKKTVQGISSCKPGIM